MRAIRLLVLLAAATLWLTACGDDAPTAAPDTEVDGGSTDTPGGGDGDAPDAGDGSCEEIDQAALDLFLPGMVPTAASELPAAALACNWELEESDGAVALSMQRYGGAEYFSREIYDADALTDVDLCDDAFLTEDIGLTLQVLDGDRVHIFGATQTLVDEDEKMSVAEGTERLTAFAEAVTGC